MKGRAVAILVSSGLCAATVATAMDIEPRVASPGMRSSGFQLTALFSCDNANPFNAYFQDDVGRYGNVFTFPADSRLNSIEFVHFGYGFSGPYDYDVEVWDRATCTYIGGHDGLSAADAANQTATEMVDLCPDNLVVAGEVVVAIDANSCIDPTDCYPDVMFDNQMGIVCPVVVDASTNTCFDQSADAGPFLLRVVTDNCPTAVVPTGWGRLKVLYR